jgi:predicted membrane-bound spermidine synthase
MAAGCLRDDPDAQARALGGLYFTNSLGAALGALLATFALLPAIGMPGAMAVAGAANLLVAAWAWRLRTPAASAPPAIAAVPAATGTRGLRVVLVAAAITGGTSFVYEIAWVRLLNTALGTTLHSFELMLAAFILGLAAGAWWIHRRGDRTREPLRLAGFAQVAMGVCAFGSALAFAQSFHWVGWMVQALPRTEAGYVGFNLGSAAVAMAVMFPAAFFAGATLPLFTVALLRRGHDERAIGHVYAANTLGAILGVLATVHVLVPAIGVHLSLLVAAAIDVGLGVALFALAGGASARRDRNLAVAAGAVAAVVALVFGQPDPLAQASGVFRTGRVFGPEDGRTVVYLADGKTATVSVLQSRDGRSRTISTNGKPDAGMTLDLRVAPVADEVTMVMLGALPLARHPSPEDVAVIGWGSGLSTHTLLGSPRVQRVETIEIEPVMHAGARAFGARVARAYDDPRSVVAFDDARTHFAAGARSYDVIVSEPSNPWVSGVAALFTEEFYGVARAHLKPGGLFVQWIHFYEMNDALLARILAALGSQFPEVEFHLTHGNDMILLASEGPIAPLDLSALQSPALRAELARVGLDTHEAFAVRRLGGRELLDAYVRLHGGASHSDFHPVVSLEGPKARFLDQTAGLLPLLANNGMPVLDLVSGRRPVRVATLRMPQGTSALVDDQRHGALVTGALVDQRFRDALRARWPREADVVDRVLSFHGAVPAAAVPAWSRDVAALARFGIGPLATDDLRGIWIAPAWLAPGQPPEVAAAMAAYAAASLRDAGAMQARATEALEGGARLAPAMRAQLLVIAMSGAAGRGDRDAVRALNARFRGGLEGEHDMVHVRRFLLAWALARTDEEDAGPLPGQER